MDMIIIGGDGRMAALAERLREAGHAARQVLSGGEDARALLSLPAHIRQAEGIVTNCPPRVRGTRLSLEELLALASPEARIYLCGPQRSPVADGRIVDLWADEALLRENARLTAEGALSAAMQAGRRSLRDLPCLVVGWGRIGAALTELLVAMGARVTVASRAATHRRRAIERGAEAVPTEALDRALPEARLVFSTPPAMVLDAARLRHVHPEALVIDLASPPYGVDLRAAWALGIRAWREPGLPGRYCPESAAQALARAILREGGERHD